jgi:hypothetical protein
MTFPRDDAGEFAAAELTQFRLGRSSGRGINRRIGPITGAVGERESSGFFRTVASGPQLSLPEPLAVMIGHAARFVSKEPIDATLSYQGGSLANGSQRGLEQPLTDWKLHIEDIAGELRVEISAALHATHLREWLKSERNFWSGQPGSRIEARFSIDPATRAACFGCYIPDPGYDAVEAPPAVPGTLDGSRLCLESAAVAPHEEFGVRNGHWINVGLSSGTSPWVAFTRHDDVRRLPNGFVSHGSYVWPRFWFRGFDVLSSLSSLREHPVQFSGAGIGHVDEWGGPEGRTKRARQAALEVALTIEGLTLDYALTTDRTYEGRVVLPWELLILRYPMVAQRREALIAS